MSVETALLPRVVDVLDRLDAQALPATPPLADQLTAAVTQVCANQGLTPAPAAIEAAVQAHLAEGSLCPPPAPLKGWGWKRPATEAEHARREKGMFRGLLAALGRNDGWGVFMTVLSIGSGITSGVLVGHAIPSVGWGVVGGLLTVIVVSVLTIAGTAGVCLYAAATEDELKKVIPDEETTQQWLQVEAARQGVRQCLASDLPCFMQGDVNHLNQLVRTEKAQEKARQAEAERTARMEEIRKQFHPENAPVTQES